MEKHFELHGEEVEAEDEEHFEELAAAFMEAPIAESVLEKVRPADGARIRFNFVTQELGIVSADGFIQTYFVPDPAYHGMSTNRAYFEWECQKKW